MSLICKCIFGPFVGVVVFFLRGGGWREVLVLLNTDRIRSHYWRCSLL